MREALSAARTMCSGARTGEGIDAGSGVVKSAPGEMMGGASSGTETMERVSASAPVSASVVTSNGGGGDANTGD